MPDKNLTQIFLSAAQSGDTNILLDCIAKKVDINSIGENQQTALHLACLYGHLDCVKILLENQADQSLLDKDGDTAEELAMEKASKTWQSEYSDILTYFRDYNANQASLLRRDIDNKLLFAAEKCLIDDIHYAITNGADINITNEHGQTPLILATNFNHLILIDSLISYGAEIDAKDDQGDTALAYASNNDTLHIMQKLSAYGADIHSKNNDGYSILANAVLSYSQPEIIEWLILNGANLHDINNDGESIKQICDARNGLINFETRDLIDKYLAIDENRSLEAKISESKPDVPLLSF